MMDRADSIKIWFILLATDDSYTLATWFYCTRLRTEVFSYTLHIYIKTVQINHVTK